MRVISLRFLLVKKLWGKLRSKKSGHGTYRGISINDFENMLSLVWGNRQDKKTTAVEARLHGALSPLWRRRFG